MLEHKELKFNSADYPLSQFIAYDGDEIIVAPDVPTEAEMRVEALKYVGREALIGAGRAAKSTAVYLFDIATRRFED
jgi:hypothetical protein